ncbi:MAG TPA: hypothetical protein VK154_05610 [Chitinophagales bacterium]|nr:hypothetical protein [Chitinophagales bacterium]
MNKTLLSLFAALIIGFSTASAGAPAEKSYSFVSSDEEFSLDVKRGVGEVKLHLTVKDMTQFDYIVIERSAENPNYFGRCKYISCNGKQKGGDFNQVDKFPYAANKDVYYRIKTVSKDGIERAYPAVLLEAVSN